MEVRPQPESGVEKRASLVTRRAAAVWPYHQLSEWRLARGMTETRRG